ncbi:MAG TPA: nucleotide sugar dehydrogenase [Geminicoccaceae bacterium]|nr:nucleotide sugar dehydrogenase [Geminicoccus sp.]HMU50782.1 nucleotide sugar dehydrogenase [Geminicoccaceae bacterium]
MRARDRALSIAMLGLGYVGTTTAACLLKDGHHVVGVDVSPDKLDSIGRGRSPVVEPGVDDLLAEGFAAGRLQAGPRLDPWLDRLDLAMVCVGTPSRADGKLELTHLLEVSRQLGQAVARRQAPAPLLLVFRSTVPPGTMESLVLPTLRDAAGQEPGDRYEVAFNPEFLRESTAIKDYYAPPKIVIGERAPGVTGRLAGIYDGIEAPSFEVPFKVAETVKFVDNSFHALKVAFANEIGRICLAQGVDPQAVADVFLADTKLNISPVYLRPGGPYGGSCLPKDLGAMIALGREQGTATPLLEGVRASNAAHLAHLVATVRRLAPLPGPILQLGLSFKAGTDDLRNSPLVDLAEELAQAGYELRILDPDVDPARLLGANFARAAEHRGNVLSRIVADPAAAADGAVLAVLGKPMPALRQQLPPALPVLDVTRLRSPA